MHVQPLPQVTGVDKNNLYKVCLVNNNNDNNNNRIYNKVLDCDWFSACLFVV